MAIGKDKEKKSRLDTWSMGIEEVKVDLKRALFGGGISVVIILAGSWLVGEASGSEAYQLFKSTLPATRSFFGTLLLGLGNILALMLTLLSLSKSLEINIKWTHYQRVKQIALTATVTLVTTTVLYLLLNIPLFESDSASIRWFTYIYYITLITSSIVGGAFITIILLLYNTVRDMIGILHPDRSHQLHHTEEE
ncbi:hypothetical protein SAMN05443144_10934 [Fodinibius roseus]|uniref:Uncharacterized protein n=1 Tax=Fodinibius roseus TaxID=1194090 RepID=A0A1M5BYY6_9BACT|nr:hypothetical protein [Fodinibius roseus]SHF47655.1 hypothetical protein SAMN05443144_10934 [Fodinibius roseus]